MPSISRRALNRTLLQRQLLSDRSVRPALEVLRHLVAVQSQEPNWPYVGLWTRMENFKQDELTSLLNDRRAVRSTVLRGTQHLVATDDFGWLRPTVQPVLERTLRAAYYAKETADLDVGELASLGREIVGDRTLLRRELSRTLAERCPGHKGAVLAGAVELQVPLVHPTPGGTWGTWGTRGAMPVALAEAWTGRSMEPASVETLIDRYLATFGPASIKDMQAWSGLTRLREVVVTMGARLRVLHDEQGSELFDLADASYAHADSVAPVRLLPAYDNLLLGHADRTRVIGDEDRKLVMPGQGQVLPTFLVDGFVRGTWALEERRLWISPFRALSRTDSAAVAEEAARLLPFLVEDTTGYDITVR
ncbi:winged helix DNA-binding domain-containing protein [Streptomyces sp. BA2]|uniref:winged helix DNA-binding domain-containing protein n=1 Tax=Streptomyces sp. BA2 TaxID=436595 RepID=UPI001321C657|nr:winged helix DNA-binding domain-containing protein [Streptomyces sp. BA2]MWA08155.1 winged helix DNA-binding domain-containing protein [Streptomyces sp. BA2]